MTKPDDTQPLNIPTQTTLSQPAQTLPKISNYKLIDILGEGGFGVVYLAQQTKPVKRRVALKVIKPGMDSKAVIARFEAERQALAMMNHPNVAKVFDAGTTEQGRPYFVMELVTGVPITEHCDRHKLNIEERLSLFINVCNAVQHAHQKGIIHRDIKPSNILVEYRNNTSIIKVIDFGVAKAIEQKLSEKTIYTLQGQLIGTPAYMSPEQAEMSAQDIDTRSDIYSLGVVLYQLLTGVTPFDAKTLMQAGWEEIRRVIREQEPQKPSTKLSSIGDELVADSVSIAHNRHTNPDTLTKHLRGDLDWITIKALEKDRTRRYATATEFADDLRRHLHHEPVLASPPSSGYRFKKFIRRNKGPVTAVSAVLVALTAGLAMTVHLYIKAEEALVEAETARAETIIERDNAQREAETAKQVQHFMIDLFKVSDPSEARGNTITAREIMDRGAERIGHELSGQPLIQATLFQTISSVYTSLGLYHISLPLAQQALRISKQVHGDEHPDVANNLHNLAEVLQKQGKYAEAEKLFRQALSMSRKLLGEEHADVFENLHSLAGVLNEQGKYAEGDKLRRQAITMGRKLLGDESPIVATSLSNLASDLYRQRKYAKAEKLHREVLAMQRKLYGDKHPSVASSLNNLASDLSRQQKFVEAEKLYRQALAMHRKLLGDEHPDIPQVLNNLASDFFFQRKYADAEKIHREVLAMHRKLPGDEHPDEAAYINNLANDLYRQGKYVEAEKLHREALALWQKLLGNDHPDVLNSLGNLANTLEKQNKYAEAEQYHRQVLDLKMKLLGDEHISVANSLINLAKVLSNQNKYAEAEKFFRKALAMRRKLLGEDHLVVAYSLNNLAVILEFQRKYAEAEQFYRQALPIKRKRLGAEHPNIAQSLRNLVDVLKVQGKFEEVRPFAAELLEKSRKLAEKPDANANNYNAYAWDLLTIEPADLRDPEAALYAVQKAVELSNGKDPNVLDTLALAQQMTGDIDAAVKTEQTAVSLLLPGPSTLRTALETNLTGYLIEQQSYAQAEPLLLALHKQLSDNPQSLTTQKKEAIDRIVQLYNAWHTSEPSQNYDEKAAQWRSRLAQLETSSKNTD